MHHLIRRRYSGIPDLSDKPLFEGPWRVPDSVHRYAETHELVGSDGKLDRDRASKVLAGQLGRRFTGYRDLYARPYGWVAKEIVASVPRKHRKAVLRDAANHHRYDSTVLVRLLTTARRFGIVESSRFRMLRGQNRSLWAALGSVGRQSIFVEGLGIVGQYDYERGCSVFVTGWNGRGHRRLSLSRCGYRTNRIWNIRWPNMPGRWSRCPRTNLGNWIRRSSKITTGPVDPLKAADSYKSRLARRFTLHRQSSSQPCNFTCGHCLHVHQNTDRSFWNSDEAEIRQHAAGQATSACRQ